MIFGFRYPTAKGLLASYDIIITATRHVEAIILMTRCGSEDKK